MLVLLVVLGAISSLIVVLCYFVFKKDKSSRDHTVSFRHDPQRYGSHDGSFVVIEGEEEVDCEPSLRGTLEANLQPSTANTHTTTWPPLQTSESIQQPTNTRDTASQSTAAVQSSNASLSPQIPSPPSSPKLEEAVADPTQNPLVCTSTLLPSY